jgi:hypothetical protein
VNHQKVENPTAHHRGLHQVHTTEKKHTVNPKDQRSLDQPVRHAPEATATIEKNRTAGLNDQSSQDQPVHRVPAAMATIEKNHTVSPKDQIQVAHPAPEVMVTTKENPTAEKKVLMNLHHTGQLVAQLVAETEPAQAPAAMSEKMNQHHPAAIRAAVPMDRIDHTENPEQTNSEEKVLTRANTTDEGRRQKNQLRMMEL